MANSNIILETNIPCEMRDGTILYADVYRPDEPGRFPVLLTRLPYNKSNPFYSHRYLDTNRLVQHDYVVVIQDVRGRYASEGDFFPFENEAEDGYDTVEWAASLPYSSGEVGMFGLSYYGFTQLIAAAEQPPSLTAIFPAMTPNDFRNDMIFHDGAQKIASLKTWTLESIVPDLLKRKYTSRQLYQDKLEKWAEALKNLESSYQEVNPNWDLLKDLDVADFYLDLLNRPANSTTWNKSKINHLDIKVPAFHLAGWYDNFLKPTIENFIRLKNKSNFPHKLMIGPWTHGDFSDTIGDLNFGIQASEDFLKGKEDLTSLHLRWFDTWLKNKQTGIEDEPPISIFVMGINEWRDEFEWPLKRTKYTHYYFHSKGHANSRYGDGMLSMIEPESEPPDTYKHNPNNPVPTQGGQTLYHGIQTSGPKNQSWIEARQDILVFTSKQLEKPVEVTGPIKVVLWATTDAEDIDFTAKLVDVHPNGDAYNLTDGIVRAKHWHDSMCEDKFISEITRYEIDLWSTSNMFLPGHKIRVDIASSNYPHFDVNQQTGNTSQATQVIFHDKSHPSHILLPIIPRS